jgi:hypothetical protein
MHVKRTDRELIAAFIARRGITKFAPQKGRPQSLRIVKATRRAARTRK